MRLTAEQSHPQPRCRLYEQKLILFFTCSHLLKVSLSVFLQSLSSPLLTLMRNLNSVWTCWKKETNKKQQLLVRLEVSSELRCNSQNLAVLLACLCHTQKSLGYYPKCAHSVFVCALVPAVLAHPDLHRARQRGGSTCDRGGGQGNDDSRYTPSQKKKKRKKTYGPLGLILWIWVCLKPTNISPVSKTEIIIEIIRPSY